VQTRKDLLQAHRLMTQRAALALILGQPDTAEAPMRRLNVAAFSGVMITVVVMAIFGIVGILRPGGAKRLQEPGTLIIEKETGARYVWCQDPPKLCPVANYVSARLLAGQDAGKRRTVSRNSLRNFQRGPLIGIPEAPNTLPEAKHLVKTPWSACVRTVELPTRGRTSLATMVVGTAVGGQSLRDDQGLVIRSAGQTWLIWKNQRLRIPEELVPALAPNPARVTPKWLNALPPGPDYKAPSIPNLGQEVPGPEGGKARVGQFYAVETGSTTTWYVQLADGLAPISEIEKELLRADPAISQKAYSGRPAQEIALPPYVLNSMQRSSRRISKQELQGAPPTIIPYADSTPLCVIYDDPTGERRGYVTLNGRLPDPPQSTTPFGVDQLVFPPGGAALVGSMPAPGKGSEVNSYSLVAEGRRYQLESPEVAELLGYEISQAVPVPSAVLNLIPTGPTLDPDAASQQLTGGPR